MQIVNGVRESHEQARRGERDEQGKDASIMVVCVAFAAGAVFWIALAALSLAVLVLSGCPGGTEYDGPADLSACCECLASSFPADGEPCIYEAASTCKEHAEGGQDVDTWGVCLAELCVDPCAGLDGAFDVIRWEP